MKANPEARGPRLTVEQLKAAAAEMRTMNIVSIFAAGSGHPGGTLSVMDIAAALYLNVLNHDPGNPVGHTVIEYFGLPATKRPHSTSLWAVPDTSPWTTSCSSGS